MINVNQLTAQLRMLPDAVLQRVAMMYKNDPYILPMVVSEGMARKKMRAAGQIQAVQPQPKVNDQAVASLGYTPEEMGIAGLSAPNMQGMADGGIAGYDEDSFAQRSEPVVRMAGGGVARYQRGGDVKSRFVEQYRDVAEKVGAELGVDPDIILSQWGLESGWGTKTVGNYNLGNIKDFTGKGKKAFDKLEGSESAYKSYKSPEDFARDYTSLIKRNFPDATGTGRDVSAFTAGLSKGKTGAYATDPEYGKKLATTLTNLVPVGSAQAAPARQGEIPTPVGGAQIPGQAPDRQAPPAIPEGFFSRLGSDLGMSEETKRNIGNILMAPTPMGVVTAPAKGAGQLTGIERLQRFFGSPSAARVLTPEEIAATQRYAQGVQSEAQAVKSATRTAQEAGATVDEAAYLADLARRTEAAKAAKAAADRVPSAAEQTQLLQQAERAQNAARATQVVSPAVRRAQEAKQATALSTMLDNDLFEGAEKTKTPPAAVVPPDLTDKEKDKVIDAAKSAVKDPSKAEGWTNDDWLNFGFAMLANRSPYFMEAVGMAGLKTLAAKQEKAKFLEEKQLREAQREKLKAETAAITDTKVKQSAYGQAVQLAKTRIAQLKSVPQNMGLTDQEWQAKENQIIEEEYARAMARMTGQQVAAVPTQGAIPSTPPPGAVKKIG